MGQIIDSSILVALFIDSDTQHKKAKDLWRKIKGTVYIPYCVVSEVTTILAYKHSKEQADVFIDFITNAQSIKLIDDDFIGEMDFYRKIKQRFSFTDVALIYNSIKLKAGLLTFDKQLEKAYKNEIR